MTMKSTWKIILSYTVCIVILLVLTELIWGIFSGILINMKIGTDHATQEEILQILKNNGIEAKDTPIHVFNDDDWYKNLPSTVQEDLENVVNRKLQDINWFGVTFAVSSTAFAIVGFLCGFLNKASEPVGILVIISFLFNNPVVRFAHAKNLSLLQKIIVVVLAQVGICYFFGFLGALIGRRLNKRKT